jgi:dTMP kinase
MSRPFFISFEGGEGVDKTTQIELLSQWMLKLNIPHVLTKEPGSPHLAECVKLRNLLLDPANNLTPTSELMLFLADRAIHVERFIKPKLKAGIHVICDRYIDSTRVYQGVSRGLGRTKLDPMLEFTTGGLMPDFTFVFDVPPEVGLERARAKGTGGGDRIEREALEFHMRVRQGFLKLAESLSDQGRIILINAAPPKTIDQVHAEVVTHMSKRLWVTNALELETETESEYVE